MSATWLADHLIWADDRERAADDQLRLRALHCPSCDRCSFPSQQFCSWCGGEGNERAIGSSGRVVASTAVLHPTPGAIVEVPYVVALVRFDDVKLDILGRVVSTADADAVPPGTPVTTIAEVLADGRSHYAFTTITNRHDQHDQHREDQLS